MSSLADHRSASTVKLLVVGESGAGKSGGLASLIDAGLRLRILDFDDGLSPLAGFVKDKSKLANAHFISLRDKLELMGGKFVIKKASGFADAMSTLMKGGDKWGVGSGIPSAYEWGPQDVLVVDSLSMMGRSALLMVMEANGAAMKVPEIQHYGLAMEQMEKFVGEMTSPAIGCHIIFNTHVSTSKATMLPCPEVLGDKLGPKIPRYFDNMVSLSVTNGKRTYKTKTDSGMALKTAKPLDPIYPLETGLADIIRGLTGKTDLAAAS